MVDPLLKIWDAQSIMTQLKMGNLKLPIVYIWVHVHTFGSATNVAFFFLFLLLLGGIGEGSSLRRAGNFLVLCDRSLSGSGGVAGSLLIGFSSESSCWHSRKREKNKLLITGVLG